ncbi:MAG: hypothetical protein ACWGQW_11835, partial [bacterium]
MNKQRKYFLWVMGTLAILGLAFSATSQAAGKSNLESKVADLEARVATLEGYHQTPPTTTTTTTTVPTTT